ncbi:hypothetical protein B5F10_14735 [Anaerotruncus colihominis]|uniref:Uncharacterized protein n=1 Tax=Anaerotruncus colihominis TaxID=169435 RepID=A0A1Y4MV33_9FIRM|nr:hypothetical protein [Anaerotruncus colihominis]OUP68064.1 hypothetical protein B5F11_14980 [Anaerotruncus colihominis]OUP72534.1 hypothetical protein B5F10_14735 [Anaerotruncus colihominis]
MNSKIRLALTGTYEHCIPFGEGIEAPFLKYRAIGYEVCERCLYLDGLCKERSEALAIEESLTCSCPHVWDAYVVLNNEGITSDIVQAGLKAGISLSHVPCASLCSAELLTLTQKAFEAANEFYLKQKWINHMVNSPLRADIAPNEIQYCHNVKQDEAKPYIEARRNKAKTERAVNNFLKNLVRDSQGLPRVGEGWVNETKLFHIVQGIFPSDKVIHHYRAEWLGRLELDVYNASKNIAFEYQGIQHFEPQKHWGGEESFERTLERDAEKKERCNAHNTPLIEICYDEVLNVDLVRKKLDERGLIL